MGTHPPLALPPARAVPWYAEHPCGCATRHVFDPLYYGGDTVCALCGGYIRPEQWVADKSDGSNRYARNLRRDRVRELMAGIEIPGHFTRHLPEACTSTSTKSTRKQRGKRQPDRQLTPEDIDDWSPTSEKIVVAGYSAWFAEPCTGGSM